MSFALLNPRPAHQRGDARASRSPPSPLVPRRARPPARRRARAPEPRTRSSPSSPAASHPGSRPTRPGGLGLGPDGNLWMGETRGAGRIAKVTPAGAVTEFTGGVTPGLTAGQLSDERRRGPRRQPLVHASSPTRAGSRRSRPRVRSPSTARRAGTRRGDHRRAGRRAVVRRVRQPRADREDHARPARSAPSPPAAPTSRPTPSRAGSRSGRTATSGSPSSRARADRAGDAGGRRDRVHRRCHARVLGQQAAGRRSPPGRTATCGSRSTAGGRIGRITPAGVVTEFAVPRPQPALITSGPDGALWFTEQASPGGIGRITTAGVVTDSSPGARPGSRPIASPLGITTGADGNVWFSEAASPARSCASASALRRCCRRRRRRPPTGTPGHGPTATAAPGPGPGPCAAPAGDRAHLRRPGGRRRTRAAQRAGAGQRGAPRLGPRRRRHDGSQLPG